MIAIGLVAFTHATDGGASLSRRRAAEVALAGAHSATRDAPGINTAAGGARQDFILRSASRRALRRRAVAYGAPACRAGTRSRRASRQLATISQCAGLACRRFHAREMLTRRREGHQISETRRFDYRMLGTAISPGRALFHARMVLLLRRRDGRTPMKLRAAALMI